MVRITFGDWLKEVRRQKGFTQQSLADAIGVDRSYIVKIETGKVGLPQPESRARFHDVLETTELDLLRVGVLSPPPLRRTPTGEWVRVPTPTETPPTGARESPASVSSQDEPIDADAPLTPAELAELSTVFFTGLDRLEPRKLRAVLRVLREGEP